VKKNEEAIDKAFKGQAQLTTEEFDAVTTDVCGFPKFFRDVLFNRIDTEKTGKVNKAQFVGYWKRELEKLDSKRRFFKMLKQPDKNYI